MKSIYNKLKLIAGAMLLAIVAVSCLPETQTMGDAGQTLVKLDPSGFAMAALDAKATPQTAILFMVRRNAHSNAALNTQTTVVLTYDADTSIIKAYNTAEGTEFIPLPTSLGTTSPAVSGGKVTLVFEAGEFSKPITVNVPNATQFDFSKQYALAYTLTEITGTGKISEGSDLEVIAQVLVKNKYDGKYQVEALSPMVDVTNATLTGYYPFTYELETSGANSVTCLLTDPAYYTYYHPITSGTSLSAYGSFGLELFFDPTTGAITEVRNPWGNPPSSTRMPVIDPTGLNYYDAATKKIWFKYWMIQPSVVTAAPHIRVYFDEVWTYKGPR